MHESHTRETGTTPYPMARPIGYRSFVEDHHGSLCQTREPRAGGEPA